MTDIYTERGAVPRLVAGETIKVRGIGNSMVPILKSGQVVTVEPVKKGAILRKGEIVLAKVKGRVYLHKVTGLRQGQVQVGNNRGYVNGWTSREQVYGRVVPDPVEPEDPPAMAGSPVTPPSSPPAAPAVAEAVRGH
jgi:hypothetical protein